MTSEDLLPDDLGFEDSGFYVAQRPQYLLRFSAYGNPAPQGSKTLIRNDRNGKPLPKPRLVESADISGDHRVKGVQQFRQAVGWFATAALRKLPAAQRRQFPLDGPLVGAMVFTVKRHTEAWRADAPAVMPDLSKYLRAAEDALKGIVIVDDGRIVGYDTVWKAYPGRHPWALDRPGVMIGVRRPTHEELGLDPESYQGLKYARLLQKWGDGG